MAKTNITYSSNTLPDPQRPVQLIREGSMRDRDPSLTLTLRTQLGSAFSGRFRAISAGARNKIVTENFFEAEVLPASNQNIVTNQYSYPSSPSKVSEFLLYIEQMVQAKIFEREFIFGSVGTGSNYQEWYQTYIQTAYKKGLQQSRADLEKMGFGTLLPEASVAITAYLSMPVHIDALETVYIRMFESLKGITAEMSAQISSVLTQGIAEGRSPLELARLIANRIDKIGTTRAKKLARTEIVRAHNIAAINNYELLGTQISENLMAQYWTALDERVRSRHRQRHGRIISFQEARELIGEPNCRCSILPYLPSINEGEDLNIPYPGWVAAAPEGA